MKLIEIFIRSGESSGQADAVHVFLQDSSSPTGKRGYVIPRDMWLVVPLAVSDALRNAGGIEIETRANTHGSKS